MRLIFEKLVRLLFESAHNTTTTIFSLHLYSNEHHKRVAQNLFAVTWLVPQVRDIVAAAVIIPHGSPHRRLPQSAARYVGAAGNQGKQNDMFGPVGAV